MGDFLEDGFEAFKYGFTWIKNIENWKTYLVWILAYFLIFGSIIAIIGVPIFLSLFSTRQVSPPDLKAGFLLWTLFASLAIVVMFLVFQMFLIAAVTVRSLTGLGIKAPAVSTNKIVDSIFLSIILAFKLYFMWYDFKWFAIFIASLLLILLSPLFIIVAFFAYMAYIFALVYYSVRLSFSLYVFFASENMPASQAIDTSLALTNGYFWQITGRNFIAGLIIGAVFFGLTLVPALIANVIDAVIGYSIFSNLFSAIINPLQVMTGIYTSAYVYSKVLELNGEKLDRMGASSQMQNKPKK